jgi:hypothetical protein
MLKFPCAAKHIKTGDIYTVLHSALDATNHREGNQVVVYTKNDIIFVRDLIEFIAKFEILS